MHKTDLPIAAPCHADWNAMKRGDKSRFCGECKKVVHDLTKLTRHEAKALLASSCDEAPCVRYLHDELGHVAFVDTFRDRPVPASALLRKVAKAAAATALLAVPMSLTACMGAMQRPPSPPVEPSTIATDTMQRDAGAPPPTASSAAPAEKPVNPLAK